MDYSYIHELLEQSPQLKDKLYCRGFLFAERSDCVDRLPFLKQWKQLQFGNAQLFVHPKQNVYLCGSLCLVGHAYDPVDMLSDENEILKRLDTAEDFFKRFNQLTGIFTLIRLLDNGYQVLGDPTGMQTTFYSVRAGEILISSHVMILGELLDLEWDPFVERLLAYRFFPLLGNSLPGDLTQFSDVKLLIPNHFVQLTASGHEAVRFYFPRKLPLDTDEIVDRVSELLRSNLILTADKWAKPAISLTGGCDSKTTLACADGLYDRFSYFSYISSDSEKVDAEAAAKICAALGLPHKIYEIPETDELVPGAADAAKLLRWNASWLRPRNGNDVRKRLVLADTADFDVEVKSWASEVGRAYYSKRFNGRTDFGSEPTPRACTTLYKFFFHNRRLVRETDQVFRRYLETYFRQDAEAPIPWQEQFFWEFRMPSWNGLVITGEHRYSFDITIPYNNRLILELLLSTSIENRIHDVIYSAIRQKMNARIDNTGIFVQNVKHTHNRSRMENMYYRLNRLLP